MQMVKKPANIYLWFSLSLPVPLSASGRYSTSTLFQRGIRGRATPASISLHSACFIFNDSTYTATIGGNCKHLYKLTFSCRSCHLESRTKDTRHTDDIGECCQVRGAEFSGWPGEVMVTQVADRSLSPQILPHAPAPHSPSPNPIPASLALPWPIPRQRLVFVFYNCYGHSTSCCTLLAAWKEGF